MEFKFAARMESLSILLKLTTMNAGRGMKFEGHGEDQYSWPIIYMYPEVSGDNYKYFPSTTSSCSYRKLNVEEKNSLILKAFNTCVVGTEGTQE
jgi:hypothetical protein